ncbi:MAG: hypothetical protein IT176_10560 [Acidobacteria bacterium]|nr:hypothetical protein [Acidobacteriota bacterium]
MSPIRWARAGRFTPHQYPQGPGAHATRVSIRPAGGGTDSVNQEQPMRIEATRPADGAPPAMEVTITTSGGNERTVTLQRQEGAAPDGSAVYATPSDITIGGRNGVFTGVLERRGTTMLASDVSNGETISVSVRGGGGEAATTIVYNDPVQQGLGRIKDSVTKVGDELVRQKQAVDRALNDPSYTKDPRVKEELGRARQEVDWKLRMATKAAESLRGDEPLLRRRFSAGSMRTASRSTISRTRTEAVRHASHRV